MNNLQTLTDKTAIGLSFLCVAHCFALPVILVVLPSVAALGLQNEAFHFWMVLAVIPTSIYALTLGCKQHKRYSLLAYGAVGIGCLILALLSEALLGETGEKVLTSIGGAIIAYGHFRNYRLCSASKTAANDEHHDAHEQSDCSCS